jgi:hypothetical protein
MIERRFPPPWTVEEIPGGLVVRDAKDVGSAQAHNLEQAG